MNKQSAEYHPSKANLKRFLSVGDKSTAQHIVKCIECQTAVQLLRAASSAKTPLAHSESVIQRLVSLPALASGAGSRPVFAKMVVDSWQLEPASAVRHAGYGVERRLRFQARGLCIDLIVDRLGDKAECSLRISRRGRSVSEFVISIGDRKILPCDKGFFNWTAIRPPGQILLWSPNISIKTGNIKW